MQGEKWSTYDQWNAWLAEILFPELGLPAPVYLDVEDDVLAQLADRADVPADAVEERLLDVVRRTLSPSSTAAFRDHQRRLATWRSGSRTDTNPLVALLAVFSLAAEQMAAGDGMSPHNYYGRLCSLLGTDDKDGVAASYRAVAEPFWASLNLWLEGLGGRRGLPTAYSVGMRYVGLAVSQALVREADRRSLNRFFADFALAPRSELPPSELLPLIDSWITQSPSPASAHLVKLWGKTKLQERIAEVAATLLSEWDGAEHEGVEHSQRGRIRLVLHLTAFPRRRARLSPMFFVPEDSSAREASVVGKDRLDVTMVPSGLPGAITFADPGIVDAADLLEGVLTVEDARGGRMERRPRGLVVFRRDDLSGAWLEVPQVLLGDDVVLLVADRLLEPTRALLDQIARPGWEVDGTTPGVPAGWTLVRGVEIFGRPSQPDTLPLDVRALSPLTSSQLKLAGGFALPGPLRHRWHSWQPPEVRAISDAGGFSVRLVSLGPPDQPDEEPLELEVWSDGGTGSVIQPLEGLELEDGDYLIELVVGDNVTTRKAMHLRSSDHPDESQWSRVEPIVHDLSDALAAVGADGGSPSGRSIHGVEIELETAGADLTRDGSLLPPARPWWKSSKDGARRPQVQLRRPDPKSCFYTGAHRMNLEQVPVDPKTLRPTVSSTAGVCEWCGLEKRYSASYWRNKRRHARKLAAGPPAQIDVRSLPSVSDATDQSTDWSVALDALQYAGGGSVSALARVASQLDPSRVFFKEFVQTLEALGHIEIKRSQADLSEVSWEVASSAIIDTGSERVLTGCWPPSHRDIAERSVVEHGHDFVSEKQPRGPERVATTATDDELLEWLDIGGIPLVGDVATDLVQVLPPLSAVVEALPRRKMSGWLATQWFDPASAAWVDGIGIEGVGAYRVGRFASEYFYRTERDLEDGTAAISDVYLVKHAAAADLTEKPLLAWSPDTRDLAVPLGASLPGLYQRAAVLCSGRAPERRRQYLVYRDVPEHVATRLTYLLMS